MNRWHDCLFNRRREEEEEEEEVETATTATQTEPDEDEVESSDVVDLREEVVTTVLLHPVPTPSPARRAPAETRPVPGPSKSTTTLAVVEQPEPMSRLSTEDIAQRLHSHGAGTKNVQPG